MEISVAYRTSFRNGTEPNVKIREYYRDSPAENMKLFARKEQEYIAMDLLEIEEPGWFEKEEWDTAEFERYHERFKERRIGFEVDALQRRVVIYEK